MRRVGNYTFLVCASTVLLGACATFLARANTCLVRANTFLVRANTFLVRANAFLGRAVRSNVVLVSICVRWSILGEFAHMFDLYVHVWD